VAAVRSNAERVRPAQDRARQQQLSFSSRMSPDQPDVLTSAELSASSAIVHQLLFLIEYSASSTPKWREHKRHLGLFFNRHGGFHLLLMLLNAHYNKPAAGRRPGWVFSGLRDRIQISERGLRMLINDAMAEGLVEQLPVTSSVDRRCRSYKLSASVVHAWEALMKALEKSIPVIVNEFDADALANTDYRKWDPEKPADEQVSRLPPSHRLRRSV
jgi:hypothetical protein